MSNQGLREHLSQAMSVFPADGIAYRGDAVAHADGSLQRTSANYMIFYPNSGSDIDSLTAEFRAGIEFALQFTYPVEWGENPCNPIPGGFDGYASHYSQNPPDLPAISWGIGSSQGQLEVAKRHGRGFYTRNGFVTVGSVKYDGSIDSNNAQPITATLEDIKTVEANIALPEKEVTTRSLARFIRARGRKLQSRAEYLGGTGRPIFHTRLGELMAHKLLDSIALTFS